MSNATWFGLALIVCANALVIFPQYITMKPTLTDIVILTVGAALCFAIESKEVKS